MKDAPIILDIEASGFGSGSYPIEIGVALADGRLLARLIKPLDHWTHWQESVEQVHGISRDRLLVDGDDPREVAMELNSLLENKTVYTDGWGVDRSWLALLFYESHVLQRFKLESVYSLLTEHELEHWSENRDRVLDLTGMEPHRAGTDALIVQDTYLYTLDPELFERRFSKSKKSNAA